MSVVKRKEIAMERWILTGQDYEEENMGYTITLADGQQLTELELNGNNFISKTKVDESIFKDNLETMTVSDGENETVYHDVEFIQQMHWPDGTYYLAFRELSEQKKMLKNMYKWTNDFEKNKTDFENLIYKYSSKLIVCKNVDYKMILKALEKNA